MKNIYNYDIVPEQNNLTVNTLTVNQKLTLNGATPNSLLSTDNTGSIIPFLSGPDNYLLSVDPSSNNPAWTNNIIIDRVQTNTFKIFGTSEGDILQVSNGDIARIPIGTTGQLLAVGDTNNVQWQDLILPDPLSIQDLTITTNLKLGLGFGSLFVDGSNNVYSESNQSFQDTNAVAYDTTGVFIISTTSNFTTISGRRYCLSCNFEVNNFPTAYSIFHMKKNGTALRTSISDGQLDVIHMQYIFTETVTGLINVNLDAISSAGTATAGLCTWLLIPLGI